ncbi:sodium-dependent proline transporter-like [Haliotis asinina]|uniref:sodium-dependent proline transporter-like n=1 Tax=Haliotis asinina TaxID=109174 RepID=UPI003531C6C3
MLITPKFWIFGEEFHLKSEWFSDKLLEPTDMNDILKQEKTGVNRLYDDLEMMIGYRVSPVWKAMWLVGTPLCVIVLLIGGLINLSPVTPGKTGYPAWSQAIGWVIAMCPLIPIPVGMVIAFLKEEGSSFKERLMKATKPRKEWHRGQTEEEEEACKEKEDSNHELDDISST